MITLKMFAGAAVLALALAGTTHGVAPHTPDTTGHTGPAGIEPGRTVYDGDGLHAECDGPTPVVVEPATPANRERAQQVCATLAHYHDMLQSVVNGAHG